MIVQTFSGSGAEPAEYISTDEAECATPACLETLDADEEGWPSLIYDGLVCDRCHEVERRTARKERE